VTDNEPSGPIKDEEFIDQPNGYSLLKEFVNFEILYC
jgi:hypothetical protein